MKLYAELAEWWPLLSSHKDYEEEASLYHKIIRKYVPNANTMLELGCGGGNNAYYLKKHYKLTLTDMSSQMIAESRKLNPGCVHHIADMRTAQLGQWYDVVFIHDAIMYMTSEDDLKKVFKVALNHLNDGGILLITPDYFKETFKENTEHGGHNSAERSLRYLEWSFDDNPEDNLFTTSYVYILKDKLGVRVEHETVNEGLFSMETWKSLLFETGFKVNFEEINHAELDTGSYFAIVGRKI